MKKKSANHSARENPVPADQQPIDLGEIASLLGEVVDELRQLNKTLAKIEARQQHQDFESPLNEIESHLKRVVKSLQGRNEGGL